MRLDRTDAGTLRFMGAVAVTGLLAGALAALLTAVLRLVQGAWFGPALATSADAATVAPPLLRSAAVVATGAVAALGWWLLRRTAPPPSIRDGLRGGRMPVGRVLVNALLQIVAVGSGASIGREGAPREAGAMAADRVAAHVGLSPRQRRILLAAGAGAGLAAVYDVPLAGVLFALEVLLAPEVADAVLPVLGTVVVAVVTGQVLGVAPGPLYRTATGPWGPPLVLLAVLLGPLLGAAGVGFARITAGLATRTRRRPRQILVLLPAASIGTAAVALVLPETLGNGQALTSAVLVAPIGAGALLLLAVAKAAVTGATIGAGAAGGLLNPSFSIGAAVGGAAGAAYGLLGEGASAGTGALVGAAAFLAAVNRSPLTAVALVVEFTATGADVLLPVVVAVTGATLTARLLDRGRGRGARRRS